jgi:hypothetical protein
MHNTPVGEDDLSAHDVVRGQSPDPRRGADAADCCVATESNSWAESVGDCAVAGVVEGLVDVAQKQPGAGCCVVCRGIQGEVR